MVLTVVFTPYRPPYSSFQFEYVISKTKKSVSVGFGLILASGLVWCLVSSNVLSVLE